MERHEQFWLWSGGAFVAVALAAAGIGWGSWTGVPMIIAYAGGVLAISCFIAAVAGLSFPFASSADRRREQRESEPSAPPAGAPSDPGIHLPKDATQAQAVADLVSAKDDLLAIAYADLAVQLVPWWERHQEHFQSAARELYGPGMKGREDIRVVTERWAKDAAANPDLAPSARERLSETLDEAIGSLSR